MEKTLGLPMVFPKEAYAYGARSDGDTHGVVLTKPHVVDLILDLAGYSPDRDLSAMRFLEPSCGHGAFVVPAVKRLLDSLNGKETRHEALSNAILAFDIDDEHVELTRHAVIDALCSFGFENSSARALAKGWIRSGDFLLAAIQGAFDVVVGNPPYIRIEQISPELQAEYRRRYVSIYDRADLYVAFIERSLNLLSDAGTLSFICADRWILNRYGAPLRKMICEDFAIKAYIDLHTASPFQSEVIAYPSIFAIGKGVQGAVPVLKLDSASEAECRAVPDIVRKQVSNSTGVAVGIYGRWFEGSDPWVLSSPEQLEALRYLEAKFEPLEADGETSVRIGVATGSDATYIVPENIDIEPDRLIPLVMRADLFDGKIKNAHRCVINTFDDDGKSVDLGKYPKLEAYFEAHRDEICNRHVAKKNKTGWFRTIDRIYPDLVTVPKLLIPDIAGSNEVTLDVGSYFPHHNLYFVISKSWDLEVLGGLLSSKVALFFVWSYAVKMRGGYLRFQAQYLRRIRVPNHNKIAIGLKTKIRNAYQDRDFEALDKFALEAYGIKELPNFDFVDTRI